MVIAEDKSKWKMVTYGYDGTNLVPLKLNADGELVVNIEASAINIGDVDVASPLGDQAKAASISVSPATDIPASRQIGKVAIDQSTANANEVVIKSITAGSSIVGKFGIDQTTPGTTNLVNVNGGASQSADIKVTMDSEAVVLGAGEAHSGQVGGHVSIVTGTLTRPNDTPGVYTAKDEINSSTSSATNITFANVARVVGGSGTIVMCIKKTNNVAGTSQLRLHLYKEAPTPCHDHDPFVELWAEEDHEIGHIDFGTPNTAGTGSDMAWVQVSAINMPFTCGAATRDLYGRVEVITAGSAPIASQVYKFTLRSLVD
jgi:hypothetical protein